MIVLCGETRAGMMRCIARMCAVSHCAMRASSDVPEPCGSHTTKAASEMRGGVIPIVRLWISVLAYQQSRASGCVIRVWVGWECPGFEVVLRNRAVVFSSAMFLTRAMCNSYAQGWATSLVDSNMKVKCWFVVAQVFHFKTQYNVWLFYVDGSVLCSVLIIFSVVDINFLRRVCWHGPENPRSNTDDGIERKQCLWQAQWFDSSPICLYSFTGCSLHNIDRKPVLCVD